MNKLDKWTPEEAGLLDEMKSRCLNGGNYKDEKAKEKFKMLCHLEDYAIEFHEDEKEIERLNNIINELEKLINEHELGKYDYSIPVFLLKEKLKELKESGNNE